MQTVWTFVKRFFGHAEVWDILRVSLLMTIAFVGLVWAWHGLIQVLAMILQDFAEQPPDRQLEIVTGLKAIAGPTLRSMAGLALTATLLTLVARVIFRVVLAVEDALYAWHTHE